MALASLKPSSKGVTALIVVAAVLLFGCVLAYLGAAGKVKTATAELHKKEQKVKEGRAMAQKLEDVRLSYFDTKSQLRYLETSVSTQAYVPTLLKQIESLGKAVNMRVTGVRPAEEKARTNRKLTSGKNASEGNVEAASERKKSEVATTEKPADKPYHEVTVELEGEGRYMNALDFLYKLTTFPKIISVNSVQMSPLAAGPGPGSPILSVKINVTAYVLKKSAPLPAEQTDGPAKPAVSATTSEGRDGHERG